MSDPFENEDFDSVEEWVEINDADGRKAALKHIGTVDLDDKKYYVLGAVSLSDEGRGEEGGLLLIREDESRGEVHQYSVVADEKEIENVVGSFVLRALMEELSSFGQDEAKCECGFPLEFNCFCACDDPEYLQ